MMQTLDDEQMRRDALMNQMGPNQPQPVGQPAPLVPPATLAPAPRGVLDQTNLEVGLNNALSTLPSANGKEARNALGGYAGVGQMNGFNTGGYGGDMKAANSVKNTAGRIFSRYGNDRSGFEAIFDDPNDPNDAFDADWKRYFPNATWDGRDKVNFGGVLSDFESGVPVSWVDTAKGWSGDKGEGWQWIDEVNAEGGGMQPQAADLAALLAVGQPEQPQGTQLDEVMAQIQALSQGADDPMQREALMQLLNQEQI
jgi:hypothetical protein